MSKRKDMYMVYSHGLGSMVVADTVRREPAAWILGTSQATDEWLIFEIDGNEVHRWRISQLLGWSRLVRPEDIE
jgi:hypothetical protein